MRRDDIKFKKNFTFLVKKDRNAQKEEQMEKQRHQRNNLMRGVHGKKLEGL